VQHGRSIQAKRLAHGAPPPWGRVRTADALSPEQGPASRTSGRASRVQFVRSRPQHGPALLAPSGGRVARREQQACHGEPSAPTRHRLHQHRQILLTFETSRARRRHSRARKGHSRAQMNLSRAREVHSRARMNLSAGNESLSAGNRSLSAGNERSKASNETLSARVGRPRREHVNLIEKLAAACRRNHVPGLRCPGRTRQGTLRPGGSRVGGHGVSSPPCPRQESPLRCKLPA